MSQPQATLRAFRGQGRARMLRAAGQGVVWTAAALAGRAIVRPAPPPRGAGSGSAPPPPGVMRRAWMQAFRKDVADVAAGLYVVAEDEATPNPAQLLRRLDDLIKDGRAVEARRQRRGGVEVRKVGEADTAYPAYYTQNFHFQSGGWLTEDSARRYETQVEALFVGSAGPMRRRALSLLAKALKGRDQRALRIVEAACGSGALLCDLRATFPRADLVGVDLSRAYATEARRRSGVEVLQAAAERLPFADASLDAVTCIYLFHELPPKVRVTVASEFARVLRPGGVLAFADSIQVRDAPHLARPLELFPLNFHEPFYASYQATDLSALFAEAGLVLQAVDTAFFTKAMLFRKLTT